MNHQVVAFADAFTTGLGSPLLEWPSAPAALGPAYQANHTSFRAHSSMAGRHNMDKGCPPPVVLSHPFSGNITSTAPTAGPTSGDANPGLLYGAHRSQQRFGSGSLTHSAAPGQTSLSYQAQQQQQLLLCQQQQAAAAAAAAAATNAQQQLLLARLQQQQPHQQHAAVMSGAVSGSSITCSRLSGHMQQLDAPATQQQQQAAMAARAVAAAAAASAAAAAPTGGVLYGHFRSNAVLQPRNSNAGASSRLYGYQQQQQQQQRFSGVGELPPRPAVVGSGAHPHSHQQQQQQQHSGAGSSQRSSSLAWHVGGASSSNGSGSMAGGGGRWSGPVALMELPPAAGVSQQSDAGTGSDPALECNEELQSIEVLNSQQQLLMLHQQHEQQQQEAAGRPSSSSRMWRVQEQQQLHQAAVSDQMFEDESGSTKAESDDPDDDAYGIDAMDQDQQQLRTPTAAAAQQAAVQVSVARQSVALQVLGRTAAVRKGSRVLTAAPLAAERAGAESVRSRLLITEVSVYLDGAASSRLALEQANRLMARMALPDNVTFMPISSDSFLFKAAAAWQFPAFVICLGSSYLQRMLERLPQLADAALACPGFEDYCSFLTNKPGVLPPRFCGPEALATLSMLRSVQFTCLFLATKVADQVHALGLLRFMLSHLSVNQQVVSLETAADVEARCLETLNWRLGPFFLGDELPGNDEPLWAAGMGHWDYGSDADLDI